MIMATTGELRAIIEELKLIDIGDAATYLGEEWLPADTRVSNLAQEGLPGPQADCFHPIQVPCTESSARH
jgi:hypothetical protein